MRRVLVVCGGALTLSVGQLSAQGGRPEIPDGRGQVMSVAGEPLTKRYRGVPVEALYRNIEGAFRQVGITPSSKSVGNYQVSYAASPAGTKIGNMKIESIFDCGGDKDSPIAKTAVMAIEVTSQVRPSGDGSEVVVSVLATPATPADGSPTPVCKTKGTLERRLAPDMKIKVTVTQVRRE